MMARRIAMGGSNERKVFLSHATDDKGEIERLRKALSDRGIRGWDGALELKLNGDLGDVEAAVHEARGFVLYLTPRSIGSEWVQRAAGWAKDAKRTRAEYAIIAIVRGLG